LWVGAVRERDVFKNQINLTEYTAAQGYRIDRKASSRNSAVMRSEVGDKIVIAAPSTGRARQQLLPFFHNIRIVIT
jgi:hypothetical protein